MSMTSNAVADGCSKLSRAFCPSLLKGRIVSVGIFMQASAFSFSDGNHPSPRTGNLSLSGFTISAINMTCDLGVVTSDSGRACKQFSGVERAVWAVVSFHHLGKFVHTVLADPVCAP